MEKMAVIDYRKEPTANIENTFNQDTVDVAKLKVLLYNTKENKLVSYLDYVDHTENPIAEQELSYKLHYDPAVYTVGTLQMNTSKSKYGENPVGELCGIDFTKFLNSIQQHNL